MSIILTKKSVLIYFSLLTVSTSCRENKVLSPDLRISNLHFPYAEQAVSRHRIQARFSDQYLSVVPVKHLTCMQETQLLTKHSEPQQSATMDIMHSFSRTNPIVNIDMNFISKNINISKYCWTLLYASVWFFWPFHIWLWLPSHYEALLFPSAQK